MNPTTQKISRILSLSLSLAKAHFKLRNEGSYLGIFWYLLNPIALFTVILFVKQSAFGHIEIPYYPLYLLIGLVMQNYLSRTVIGAADLIRKNGGFIKSVRIPLESLVVSSSVHLSYGHAFEALLIAGLALYSDVSWVIASYAVSIILFALFALGISFIVATLGAFANDIGNIWSVFGQILFFLTPIFYAIEPGTFLYQANQFNPLYYFISLARWPAYEQAGTTLPVLLTVSSLLAVLSLAVGLTVFARHKKRFAELV